MTENLSHIVLWVVVVELVLFVATVSRPSEAAGAEVGLEAVAAKPF